ncbi:MAG: STAS domain-containing protein, partial [Acidobacteria bacterium]|nr:STAS domain-containing protein [Acidobacteriota bacterium]
LLRRMFRELLEQGETRFVFSMLKTSWLDSGGIGEVVACHRRVVGKQGVIRLALKGRAHDLFTMTSLDKVFKIFETVEEALASLADWRPGEVLEISEPDEVDAAS